MTKESAIAMLSNAEAHLWARVPPSHFVSEHPVEHAAITDLQRAQRLLAREILRLGASPRPEHRGTVLP